MKTTIPTKTQVEEGKKMLQMPLDQDLHREFKARCIQLNCTMAEQIEVLIHKFMTGRK